MPRFRPQFGQPGSCAKEMASYPRRSVAGLSSPAEYKFLGGGWNEEGILRRRHVFVDTIEDIGKESDGWEEDDARTEDQDGVLVYPASSFDRGRMIEPAAIEAQQRAPNRLERPNISPVSLGDQC
jgi:hypothetical protein